MKRLISILVGKCLFAGTLFCACAQAKSSGSQPAPGAANPAIVPVQNTAKDNYNFAQRHAEILKQKGPLNPQIVLIGDCIRWGGPPEKGALRPAWIEAFGSIPTLNLGFGYDLTQNVLWRLENGLIEGLSPKVVVIAVGGGCKREGKAPAAPRGTPEQTCL